MPTWTEEEYMEYLEKKGQPTARKKPKRSKYNSKRIWVHGLCFDSELEAEYYRALVVRQLMGEIKGFCRQPEFILVEGNAEVRAVTYRADFIVFHLDGSTEIIDTKGCKTKEFVIKEKQFRARYPGLRIKIVK